MAGSEVVALENFTSWMVWAPVVTGRPPQCSAIFTGMVLRSLKLLSGAVKVPPVPSAPPRGVELAVNLLIAATGEVLAGSQALVGD